jgi:SAM-dependent methyltransferase
VLPNSIHRNLVDGDKLHHNQAVPDKARIANFWSRTPCGSRLADGLQLGTPEFFEATEASRYRQEPFVRKFARFAHWKGKKVLEVGCGIGTDLSLFAQCGAQAWGVDLTYTSALLAARRLAYRRVLPRVMVADSEALPFPDGSFDLVYTWGVIHHTPNTETAAKEILRVARPGGRVVAMIYNRRSLVALQAYIVYGLCRGRPFRPLREIIAAHLESPGTKAYTADEARKLFAGLENLRITPVVTPYDLRIGRNRFLPPRVGAVVPRALGYFLVVEGSKPSPS